MIYVHQYLSEKFVLFLEQDTKEKALNILIDSLCASPNIQDQKIFKEAVFNRESILSTGIGLGIAIPHVKIKEIKDITIGIGISKKGIAWNSIDSKLVHIVFLIAGSSNQHEEYLRILSKIILVLKNKNRRSRLIEAKDAESVLALFKDL